jgi:hypothetical protein
MLALAACAERLTYCTWMESGFSLLESSQLQLLFSGGTKTLENKPSTGGRLSILGLLQQLVSFVYG